MQSVEPVDVLQDGYNTIESLLYLKQSFKLNELVVGNYCGLLKAGNITETLGEKAFWKGFHTDFQAEPLVTFS